MNIWYDWMRTKYSSYARLHPEGRANDLPGATMTMFAELADLVDLRRETLRDAADGKIDDPKLRTDILREAEEAQAAIQRFMNVLKSQRERR